LVPHSPASQEIDAAIVGDPEQPGFKRAALVELVQLPIGFEQSLLNDVFTVHDRTCHAGAVAMQARTKRGDRFEEGQVARFEWPGIFDMLIVI
jgi:hypothetical protein